MPRIRRPKLAAELQWPPYCRMVGLGSSHEASCARLCRKIGGSTPTITRNMTATALELGQITGDQYFMRISAIDAVEHMYDGGLRTRFIDPLDEDDWVPCGEGHQRVTHHNH